MFSSRIGIRKSLKFYTIGCAEVDPAGQCYLFSAGSISHAVCVGRETGVQREGGT